MHSMQTALTGSDGSTAGDGKEKDLKHCSKPASQSRGMVYMHTHTHTHTQIQTHMLRSPHYLTASSCDKFNYLLVYIESIFSLSIQQVAQEKETTVSKWKQERQRRIRTEKRLRLAEDSLKRLDKALKESGVQIDIQIETDVTHLKRESASSNI